MFSLPRENNAGRGTMFRKIKRKYTSLVALTQPLLAPCTPPREKFADPLSPSAIEPIRSASRGLPAAANHALTFHSESDTWPSAGDGRLSAEITIYLGSGIGSSAGGPIQTARWRRFLLVKGVAKTLPLVPRSARTVIRFHSLSFPLGCVAESVTRVSMATGEERGAEEEEEEDAWVAGDNERRERSERSLSPDGDVDNPVPCQNTLRFFCLLPSYFAAPIRLSAPLSTPPNPSASLRVPPHLTATPTLIPVYSRQFFFPPVPFPSHCLLLLSPPPLPHTPVPPLSVICRGVASSPSAVETEPRPGFSTPVPRLTRKYCKLVASLVAIPSDRQATGADPGSDNGIQRRRSCFGFSGFIRRAI